MKKLYDKGWIISIGILAIFFGVAVFESGIAGVQSKIYTHSQIMYGWEAKTVGLLCILAGLYTIYHTIKSKKSYFENNHDKDSDGNEILVISLSIMIAIGFCIGGYDMVVTAIDNHLISDYLSQLFSSSQSLINARPHIWTGFGFIQFGLWFFIHTILGMYLRTSEK